MSCPPPDTIQDLVDGRLSRAEHDAILAHADDCASCRELLVDLVRGTAESPLADTLLASEPRHGGAPARELERELERGATVGRFIVLDELGAGSMGIVVSAYDPQLDRKVAIKVVRPGIGQAGAFRERLLREAQAMAKLSHPAVITVYEVGEIGEDIFVAMELLEGGTLSRWLAAGRRSWREVLALLARVGSGLAAAHAAGLVHRDFKPDNVLVGSDGQVRVTDFGLVGVSPADPSAQPRRPLGALALTRTGTVLGTPLYMAPEQHRGQPVDARADQFAFCVTLHQALYGTLPFGGASYQELAAEVTGGRVREPPRDAAVPARIRRVVLRGLSADPEARYPSMEALLADLARDPGRTRRRAALAAGAVALAAWGGFALWQARAARGRTCAGAEQALAGVWDAAVKERVHASFLATGTPYAYAAWRGVSRRLDDYAGAWVRMHTEACEATRHGTQSAHALDLRMGCLARRRTDLAALATVFTTADAAVVEKSVSAASSLTELDGCADLERLAAPMPLPEGVAARLEVATVRAQLAVSEAYRKAGKYRMALALVGPALATARSSGYQPALAEALLLAGTLHQELGEAEIAEQTLFDAVVAATAARHDEVEADARIELVLVAGAELAHFDDGQRSASLARAVLDRLHGDPARESRLLQLEGQVLDEKEVYDESGKKYQRALEIEQRIREPGHLKIAACLLRLGNHAGHIHDTSKAIAYYQRAFGMTTLALGLDHPNVGVLLDHIGANFSEQGNHVLALEYLLRALALRERALGAAHPRVTETLYNLALEYERGGDHALAATTFRRAVAIADEARPEHPETATMHAGVAVALMHQGKYDEALPEARRALAIREKVFGPVHGDVAQSHRILGELLAAAGDDAQALVSYQKAAAVYEQALGADSGETAMAIDDVGAVRSRMGDHAGAMTRLEQARAILESKVDKDWVSLAINRQHIGEDLALRGKHAEAIEQFQASVAIIDQHLGEADENAAYALLGIGTSRMALGAAREAVAPLERALTILGEHSVDPRHVAEVRFALARALWESDQDRPRALALAREAKADAWLAQHH